MSSKEQIQDMISLFSVGCDAYRSDQMESMESMEEIRRFHIVCT